MNQTLIKNIPKYERPRERFLKVGAENLSNIELISILLNSGTKDISAYDLAKLILHKISYYLIIN